MNIYIVIFIIIIIYYISHIISCSTRARVAQGILGRDALVGVELQAEPQQVECFHAGGWEHLAQGPGLRHSKASTQPKNRNKINTFYD